MKIEFLKFKNKQHCEQLDLVKRGPDIATIPTKPIELELYVR